MRIYNLGKISANYKISPPVQGHLKIPAKVTVTMPGTVVNDLLIDKYKDIFTEIMQNQRTKKFLACWYKLKGQDQPNSI